MRKLILLSCALLISGYLFSQRFEIETFYEDPQDYAAIRFAGSDINDQKCAIIKVRSNIDGLQFDSNLGITETEYKTGEVWLYVSPCERALKFMYAGIVTMDYNIPAGIRIEPSRVYILELVATEAVAAAQTLPVIIRFTPEDASLYINNKLATRSNIYSLAPGQHDIKIEKYGFQAIEEQISVNEQNIYYEYSLQRQPDAGLQIESSHLS